MAVKKAKSYQTFKRRPGTKNRRTGTEVLEDKMRFAALGMIHDKLDDFKTEMEEAVAARDAQRLLWLYAQISAIYVVHGVKSTISNSIDTAVINILAEKTEDVVEDVNPIEELLRSEDFASLGE